MPASYDKQLSTAQKKEQLAETKLNTLRLEQTYRALDNDHNKRKRRSPNIEYIGEDGQMAGYKRLKSVAKARDARRNFAGAKASDTQLWLNVIGRGPKIITHIGDEDQRKEWSRWFNTTWARRSSGLTDRHLADQAKMVLSSVVRDGDILCYFDSKGIIPRARGTLWYWETDQIVNLRDIDFKKNRTAIAKRVGVPEKTISQEHGIVKDEWGRALAYIVTRSNRLRGKSTAKWDEVTVLPADDCKLIYNPWRINQRRGTSSYLEIVNTWQDLERFSESLLQRAITQSFMALKVKKEGGAIAGRDQIDSSDEGSIPDLTDDATATNYTNYEKLAMNAIEYLDDGDDVEAMQMSGDLPDAKAIIDFLQGGAGWANGLSAMYSTGKADASYSASMAESNMTWAMFEWWQKFMERYFFDWVAEKAFRFGMGADKITVAKEIEWLDNYSWHNWPKRRAINPAQEATARKTDLEVGAIDYSDIHGPDWREKLANLGEQIKWSRDHNLFVPIFQPPNQKG